LLQKNQNKELAQKKSVLNAKKNLKQNHNNKKIIGSANFTDFTTRKKRYFYLEKKGQLIF